MKINKCKVLVTGGGGMVGMNLREYLSPLVSLTNTYYLPNVPKEDIRSNILLTTKDVFLDVMSQESVKNCFESEEPDVVVHLAAQSRPDYSLRMPYDTLTTNIQGTVNVLKACSALRDRPLLINFSSSAVYGDLDWTCPANERSTTVPITPYGASKLAAERIVHAVYDGPAVSIRLFNCSGRYKQQDLISDIAKRLIIQRQETLDIGSLDTKRHFLHVRDVCAAVRCLIEDYCGGEDPSGFFNLAPSHKSIHSAKEVIDIFRSQLDRQFEVRQVNSLFRAKDESIIWGDSSTFSERFGWVSKWSVNDIVSDSLAYHQEISSS